MVQGLGDGRHAQENPAHALRFRVGEEPTSWAPNTTCRAHETEASKLVVKGTFMTRNIDTPSVDWSIGKRCL